MANPLERLMRQVENRGRLRQSEERLSGLSDTLLSRGGRRFDEGFRAVRDISPERIVNEELSPDALRGIFDEAITTNLMPQLRQLQARNARRNIRGPLSGALEGDLMGSFGRSVAAESGRLASTRAQIRGDLGFRRARTLADLGGTERAQGLAGLSGLMDLRLAREQMFREEDARKDENLTRFGGTVLSAALL